MTAVEKIERLPTRVVMRRVELRAVHQVARVMHADAFVLLDRFAGSELRIDVIQRECLRPLAQFLANRAAQQRRGIVELHRGNAGHRVKRLRAGRRRRQSRNLRRQTRERDAAARNMMRRRSCRRVVRRRRIGLGRQRPDRCGDQKTREQNPILVHFYTVYAKPGPVRCLLSVRIIPATPPGGANHAYDASRCHAG